MSESKHTPEPWRVTDVSRRGRLGIRADIMGEGFVACDVPPADAERACACVNALAGLNPEGVKALVEACELALRNAESRLYCMPVDADAVYRQSITTEAEVYSSALSAVRE